MAWKRLSEKLVYQNPWMRVTEEEVETDLGKRLTFGIVSKDDSSVIIPWDGERFIMVELFRYTTGRSELEFPAGHSHGKGAMQTAIAELREELGYTAGNIEKITEYDSCSSFMRQTMHIFLATELIAGDAEPDPGEEGIRAKALTPSELKQAILEGEIRDSHTLVASGVLAARGLL